MQLVNVNHPLKSNSSRSVEFSVIMQTNLRISSCAFRLSSCNDPVDVLRLAYFQGVDSFPGLLLSYTLPNITGALTKHVPLVALFPSEYGLD